MDQELNRQPELVGIVPAGGWARRLAPLPCSKEIYPVGIRRVEGEQELRPKVACHYLLESMQRAGVEKVYIILRDGKWDIPAYFGNGSFLDMHLAYLMMQHPYGPPFTVDEAYPFVEQDLVAFGFPDILFEPADVYTRLVEKQRSSRADVVLGIFPMHPSQDKHVVEVDETGRVRAVLLTPDQTNQHLSWVVAVWAPAFTRFLHNYVATMLKRYRHESSAQKELHMPDVVQAAIDESLHVNSVLFSDGTYVDIGVPENLMDAARHSLSI